MSEAVCMDAQNSQQDDPGFMLAMARLGNALESVAAPALPSSQDDGFALRQSRGAAATNAPKGELYVLAWMCRS